MSEKNNPGCNSGFREAVCVHTNKVYDACRSKECIQDLRVYLTRDSQEAANRALSIKARRAELLWVFIDVEPVAFNRGFYSVDAKFFYKIYADAQFSCGRPQEICGVATYDKRSILFGSEGSARIFSSRYRADAADAQTIEQSNKPKAVVETLDPMILSIKLVEPGCRCGCACDVTDIPGVICGMFDEDIVLSGEGRKLYVTLGQFSIIRLERDIQLLMPAYDICMPTKECTCSNENSCEQEDPCAVFDRFDFPVDEFFPPKKEQRDPSGCQYGSGGSNGSESRSEGGREGRGGRRC
ncbi:MAG: hypothetical protein ACI4PQ_02590 [Butyricicoccaceae bacterium]